MDSMRAARATGPGKIELANPARPIPGPGDVVLQVRACGICGSDLHFFGGQWPAPSVCPGHEISGELVEVGSGVTDLKRGDRVVIEPLLRCERCWACRVGDYQLCEKLQVLGVSADGGFADFLRVPAYTLFPLPDSLDFDVGALAEPLAVTVHGVRLADVRTGDRVAILGAGTIGLVSILAARAAGAIDVLITARHPQQIEAARRLGATPFTSRDGTRELLKYAATHPIDVVVETVGGEADTLKEGLRLIRKGGRIVILGIYTHSPTLDPIALVLKEPRIIGSITYGRHDARADFDVALEILHREREHAHSLITHRFSLDDVSTAFETAANKASGAVKVLVTP